MVVAVTMTKTKLKDVCDRITVGHVGPMADKYTPDGVPFLRSQNITPFRLHLEDIKFVPRDFHELLRKSALRPGDVAVVRTGYPGTACVIPETLPESNCADLVVITPSKNLNPYFLAAIFNSAWGKSSVAGNLVGVAQQHFNVGAAKEMEVTIPSRAMQVRIAGILSAYDDLIENNLRRIRILEEMARALYREWFVHFRVPGHERIARVDSPLGSIPRGWNVMQVKDVLTRRPSGQVYRESDVSPEGSVPVVDQSTAELIGFHDNEPDHPASPDSPIAIFGDHTCKMELLVQPFSIGPNVVAFTTQLDRPLGYVFFAVRGLVQTQEYKRHWTQLNAKQVMVADRSMAEQFADHVRPSLHQIEVLRRTNRALCRSRDLLLPRLIGGQIALAP